MVTRQDYLKAVGIPAALPPDMADEELDEDFYNYVNTVCFFFDEERRDRVRFDIYKKLSQEAFYCPFCGQQVFPEQKFIYSKTKRGGTIYAHDECFRREAERKVEEHD